MMTRLPLALALAVVTLGSGAAYANDVGTSDVRALAASARPAPSDRAASVERNGAEKDQAAMPACCHMAAAVQRHPEARSRGAGRAPADWGRDDAAELAAGNTQGRG
jgi:hypothetical protein